MSKDIIEDNDLIQTLFETNDFNDENTDINTFKEKFKNENDFKKLNNLKQIHKELIIKGCDLNPDLLDNKGNKEFKWSQGEKRGGFDYIPPHEGWKGFGIKVLNKFDDGNNDWLSKNGNKNEWAIAYHGIGIKMGSELTLEQVTNRILKEGFKPGNGQAYAEDDDERHPGKKVGIGVYCSPSPSVMESYADWAQTNTFVNKRNFMMGFMIRVKPDKIRYSKNMRNYWVLSGSTDEMRPYRILVKEKKEYIDLSTKTISIKNNYNSSVLKTISTKDNYNSSVLKTNSTQDNFISSVLSFYNKNNHEIVADEFWWSQLINYCLFNSLEFTHIYSNVLTEVAILGKDGILFARTRGLDINKNEFKAIQRLFSYGQYNYSAYILYLYLGRKKYRIIHYDEDEVYLILNGCGATIAKSKKTYIIGMYDTGKKYFCDGEEKSQCVGMCNTIVEELALYFKKINY